MNDQDSTNKTVIYPARRIVTMNPAKPVAEAVAVRGDRILAVGTVEELSAWNGGPDGEDVTVDERFAKHVLVPGFIEAHSHYMAGGMWTLPYVGFFDRNGADGKLWTGCTSIDAVIDRLAEAEAALEDPNEPLLAWGLDPIYFDGERMLAHHLDRVSETRPIFVYHASAHLATVNSAMLSKAEITADDPTPGISLNEDGQPDGELQEPPAMQLAGEAFRRLGQAMTGGEAMWNYAREARNTGATLITDLGTSQLADPDQVERWLTATGDPDYPSRVMVALSSMMGGPNDPTQLAALGADIKASATDKLRFGIVKIVLDGSIQGFTARVSWPHYYKAPDGHPGNGLWLMAPDQVADVVEAFHVAGLTVHAHCNGDEASEVFIDAVETVLERHPALGPSPHGSTLSADHKGPVPAHGRARHVRKHLQQSHLLLG